MKKIYVFLATGFEEVEALGVVDICRRAALPLKTVSVTGERTVMSSHHVPVVADELFENLDFADAALLFLPGGLPGATNLADHEGLRAVLRRHYDNGGLLSAICAAPLVFGRMGLLRGVRTTCYPGFEPELTGAQPTGAIVVEDGQFVLGKGPAAVYALGYAIVARMCSQAKADELRAGMLYNDLFA